MQGLVLCPGVDMLQVLHDSNCQPGGGGLEERCIICGKRAGSAPWGAVSPNRKVK